MRPMEAEADEDRFARCQVLFSMFPVFLRVLAYVTVKERLSERMEVGADSSKEMSSGLFVLIDS